jgi:hypothetical protein
MTIAELQRFLSTRQLSVRITIEHKRAQVRFYKGRSTIAMGDGTGISRAITDAVKDYRYYHSHR